MLSRFDTILETVWDGRDRRTDGQNCYINIARHIAVLTRDKNDIEQGSLSENATWDNIWECCGVDSSDAYRVFQKKVAFHLKLLKIFSLRLGLFAWNFCRFIGSSFRHISANFCTFILIFHQMALIFTRVPIVFTVSSFEYWMQTLREQGLGEKAIIYSYTLTKDESWALLRTYAVESTTLAQPFWVNQTVGLGDLP